MARLSQLLADETCVRWAIGDQLAVLVDEHGMQISDLAERYGRRRTTLSAYYHTAKTFTTNQRDHEVAWNHYDNARRVARRFDFEPLKCLKTIIAEAITQRRDVTARFARMRREIDAQLAAADGTGSFHADGIINQCHRTDCRLITQRLRPASLKLAVLDFPYGLYGSNYHPGEHDQGAVARTDCDGNDVESVVALIDDMLRLLPPKMVAGGAALLFRPAGIDPLYGEILAATEEHGWDMRYRLTWDKGRTKLGRPDAPYAPRTEAIYILCLSGDMLVNHDDSAMSDLLNFPVPMYTSAKADDHHLFAKPLELCRHLIGKHTYASELVFDACGCSGNASIAAVEMGRNFVYCETNATNFEWGSRRIYGVMEKHATDAG